MMHTGWGKSNRTRTPTRDFFPNMRAKLVVNESIHRVPIVHPIGTATLDQLSTCKLDQFDRFGD